MTEIPMAEPEGYSEPTSGRPQEVKIAGILVLLNAITGLIVSGINFAIWESATSIIGLVFSLIGFWLYGQINGQSQQAWNWAVIILLIAAVLYGIDGNIPGVGLSLITFFYLNLPDTKRHFTR
jgi:hypothetical protein